MHRFLFLLTTFCLIRSGKAQTIAQLPSPSGEIRLMLSFDANQHVQYSALYKEKVFMLPSGVGFQFRKPELHLTRFKLLSIDTSQFDQIWSPVWGEVSQVRNQYRELILHTESSGIRVDLIWRVFNDGIGFRYHFPDQPNLHHFIVQEELTEFRLSGDHEAFWIPGDFDTNEYTYNRSRLSAIDATTAVQKEKDIAVTAPVGKQAVQTPLMLKSTDGLYINLHEAALLHYPAMQLQLDPQRLSFQSVLASDGVGNKAYLQTPFSTPWRTIVVSDRAEKILESKLILNLNEPSKYEDVSWIKPQKYMGMWWEMHIGKADWSLKSGKHGANTANVKRYIDFAALHGFDGLLVEGWNTGWEDWFGNWKEDVYDFVTPYPDYDIDSLSRYAKSKGIRLIMHHETAGSVTNYERRFAAAFSFMTSKSMNTVKTGYVGKIIPRGEHHDGQWMVDHYTRVVETAAKHQIMVNSHESVRPTGLHRTYPNWLASEAARGSEFNNAPTLGIDPAHTTILPFTRLMGGPMDYTPGIFHMSLDQFDKTRTQRVRSTLAKQLALYVTMYSPLQMAADLPENYEKHLDAFQFIKDVAVDWSDTKVLNAEPGEYLTIARKPKNSGDWFIGSITNEQARVGKIALDFLDPLVRYEAIIYADGKAADFEKNPESYTIERQPVKKGDVISYSLQRGGGCAIHIRKIKVKYVTDHH